MEIAHKHKHSAIMSVIVTVMGARTSGSMLNGGIKVQTLYDMLHTRHDTTLKC